MIARLPADLLRRSAEEGSRLLALAHLDEIASAEGRLADPLDSEALHDFRVGLRRLRSTTRAYRSQLKGSVSKRMRGRLRDLTRATNPGRDIEVQLGWLHRQAERLGAGETEGLAWLVGRLEGRKSEIVSRVIAEIAGDFLKAATKLRGRLSTFQVQVRTGRQPKPASLGQVTGGLIRSHVAELAQSLKPVSTVDDTAKAHAARIRAKRLRYLLEPLSRRARGAKALIGPLKQLQDLLGTLHDMQVMTQEIDASLEALSRNVVERPLAAEPGLQALRRLAKEEAERSFTSFRVAWAGSHAARFLNRTNELGDQLEKPRRVMTERQATSVTPQELPVSQALVPPEQKAAERARSPDQQEGKRLAMIQS
jgi:CHAD domain-containing protein